MLSRRTPLRVSKPMNPMSAKKRAERAASGDVAPRSTLTGGGLVRKPTMRTAAPVKRTRVESAAPADVRAVLMARSGGVCEMGLPGCHRQGTDAAHRLARKAGGRKGVAKTAHNQPSNALFACRACHSWSTEHPAESYRLGLMLREGQVPSQVPVTYRGRLVLLDDEGGVALVGQVAA